jgi:hypothetical protein
MQKAIVTIILAGLVSATSVELSYAAGAPGIGANSVGSVASASGLSNEAGSIAAGANSWSNPSGNTFIVTPPGAGAGGVFVRPQR